MGKLLRLAKHSDGRCRPVGQVGNLRRVGNPPADACQWPPGAGCQPARRDRKSTRLNSSHLGISYAVFCLKKKNPTPMKPTTTRLFAPTTSPGAGSCV